PSSAAPTGPSRTTEARLAAKLSDTRARATFSRAGAESQMRKSRPRTARVPQSISANDDVAMRPAAKATTPQTYAQAGRGSPRIAAPSGRERSPPGAPARDGPRGRAGCEERSYRLAGSRRACACLPALQPGHALGHHQRRRRGALAAAVSRRHHALEHDSLPPPAKPGRPAARPDTGTGTVPALSRASTYPAFAGAHVLPSLISGTSLTRTAQVTQACGETRANREVVVTLSDQLPPTNVPTVIAQAGCTSQCTCVCTAFPIFPRKCTETTKLGFPSSRGHPLPRPRHGLGEALRKADLRLPAERLPGRPRIDGPRGQAAQPRRRELRSVRRARRLGDQRVQLPVGRLDAGAHVEAQPAGGLPRRAGEGVHHVQHVDVVAGLRAVAEHARGTARQQRVRED